MLGEGPVVIVVRWINLEGSGFEFELFVRGLRNEDNDGGTVVQTEHLPMEADCTVNECLPRVKSRYPNDRVTYEPV